MTFCILALQFLLLQSRRVTVHQCSVSSHSYCSKMRCTGHLGLSHMIHSMCHCSTPGVTYTVFCLCGLNHYYKLEMWKMCEFDNGGWWCMRLCNCAVSKNRLRLRCAWKYFASFGTTSAYRCVPLYPHFCGTFSINVMHLLSSA